MLRDFYALPALNTNSTKEGKAPVVGIIRVRVGKSKLKRSMGFNDRNNTVLINVHCMKLCMSGLKAHLKAAIKEEN